MTLNEENYLKPI